MELTDVVRPPQQQSGQRSAGLFPVTGGPWPLFSREPESRDIQGKMRSRCFLCSVKPNF